VRVERVVRYEKLDSMSAPDTSLRDRILEELARKPGQKAAEPAATLRAGRREVNRCLSHEFTDPPGNLQEYVTVNPSAGVSPSARPTCSERRASKYGKQTSSNCPYTGQK